MQGTPVGVHRRLLFGTASNLAGKTVTLGVGFVLTPFIVHQLGAATYGLWVLVGSVVAYSTLLDLGIGGAVVKCVAAHSARGEMKEAGESVATALRLYLVLGLLAVIITAALAPVFPLFFNVPPEQATTARWLVLATGLSVGIAIPCTTSVSVLRGLQRYELVNLITAGATLLAAGVTLIVLLLGGGVLGLVLVNIPVALATQLVSISVLRRVAPELPFGLAGARRALVPSILSFSSSVFVIQLAGRFHVESDEIVIATALPLSAVTPYAIARKLASVAQTMSDQFTRTLFPLSAELHALDDEARLRLLCITGTRLTLAAFVPLACVLIVLAQPILELWVGPTYATDPALVVLLVLASLVDMSTWPAGAILQGMGRHRPIAVMTLVAGLANIVLSIVLVRSFGLIGVAIGTLVPTLVHALALVLPYVLRTLGVRPADAFTQVLVPVVIPAVPTVLLLVAGRLVWDLTSVFVVVPLMVAGLAVYAAVYLAVGASPLERNVCRGYLRGAVRLVGRLAGGVK